MSTAQAPHAPRPERTPSFVPAGERVRLSIKPSPLFIVLAPLRSLVATLGLSLGAFALLRSGWLTKSWGLDPALALWIGAGIAWLLLIGSMLDWLGRRYVLTDRRVLRLRGILRQHVADVPLDRVQSLELSRRLRERLFGLGSIGVSTAGAGGVPELWWSMVPSPHAALERLRQATSARDGTQDQTDRDPRAMVIGIVGGIGSGKSTVGRLIAEMGGGIVIDSDALAKQALERDDVRAQLVRWWGPGVLAPDGRVDRAKVAAIVFEKPEERTKLEALVHPIVRQSRAEVIAQAKAAGLDGRDGGRTLAVIDAPLLLEAGIDKECDLVVFVDTPRERRLARVSATRGWTEAELARREAAQWDLDKKKAASDAVISNAGDEVALREGVRAFLARIGRAGARAVGREGTIGA
ncbi:MAG: dephospho-CoA kinase [Planctomycetota bacterium]|nr:dephospho-CoA kinase [Planctomycetota bacterium]